MNEQQIHDLEHKIMITPKQAAEAAQTIRQLQKDNKFLKEHILQGYPHVNWTTQQKDDYREKFRTIINRQPK